MHTDRLLRGGKVYLDDQYEYEIDVRELLRIIRRRFWLLVLVAAATITTSAVLSYSVLPKVYVSSTTLIVLESKTPIIDYTTVMLHRQLVKTYEEIAKSRQISEQVIGELNLGMTVTELQKKVRIRQVPDTELLEIEVEDHDPVLATTIANATAEIFIDNVSKLMQVENVVVIDPAVKPLEPIRPRPLLNMAIAGVLGIMVGLGLVFLLEHLDDTIETAEDVQRCLAMPVLGEIPAIDAKSEAKKVRSRGHRNGAQS